MFYSDTIAGQIGELIGKIISGNDQENEAVVDVARQEQQNVTAHALYKASKGDTEPLKKVLLNEDGVGTQVAAKPVINEPAGGSNSVSGYGSPSGSSAHSIIYSDWSNAAKYFGMDQATAYSEHMANTAHQREVADLKAAGLNPVLGISGSGSTGVSGSTISSGSASSAEKASNVDMIVDMIGATAGLVSTIGRVMLMNRAGGYRRR